VRLTVAGQPLHTRSLTVLLTQRDDGKLRAQGDLIDLRKCGVAPMLSGLQTAGIIHRMSLAAVVDPATRELKSVDAAQAVVPVEASERSNGESCRDPVHRLQELVGRPLDGDFSRELAGSFGGPRGCSHLLLLFQLMASAIQRALDLEASRQGAPGHERASGETIFRRSVFVDGFQAVEGELQLAVQLSDVQEAPRAGVKHPVDVLARWSEARAVATVRLQDVSIATLRAWERDRGPETIAATEWIPREDEVRDLVGRAIMPGLGTELRKRLGGRHQTALLLDTLLQLAPGFVQCTPTLAEDLFVRLSGRKKGGGQRPSLPAFLGAGGAANSCYIWREGGALLRIRPPRESFTG
jgi:hypothetical protein